MLSSVWLSPSLGRVLAQRQSSGGSSGPQLQRRAACSSRQPARRAGLAVRAHGAHGAQPEATGAKTFMDEMRAYAMKLHTREQAPREGQAEAPKRQPMWTPTPAGYLSFLVESKVVYDAFEGIFASGTGPVYFKEFVGTGLERGPALEKDIAEMQAKFGLAAPASPPDSPGHKYAAVLRELAATSPTAFICHYYNFYFAHTAGGRMIGQKISQMALGGWMGAFYQWDGDVKAMLEAVRSKLNSVAEGWTPEERAACLEQTAATFGYSGQLLQLVSGGGAGGGGGGGGH